MKLTVEHEEIDAFPWILLEIGHQIAEGYIAGNVGGAQWRIEKESDE